MKGFTDKMANRRDDIPPGHDPLQDRGGRGVFGRFLDKLLSDRADGEEDDESSGKGDSSGEGESTMGSVVDGAVSKGDSDGRMTRKKQNRILRKASVAVRSMADKGDALTKATGGNFNTIESDLRRMSGADLNAYMSTNPNQMAKTGETWVRQEMIASGHKKELDVLSHGTMEAAQRDVKKDIVNALALKPMAEMTPDEVRFIQDKLSELGVYNGPSDGDIGNGKLHAAIGGMIEGSHAMQEMVKSGRILISDSYGHADPIAKPEGLSPTQSDFFDAVSRKDSPSEPAAAPVHLDRKKTFGL